MLDSPVSEIPSNSHCSQLVAFMAGVIFTESMCSKGELEKWLGPSKISKAVLLLMEHESSNLKSNLVGNWGVRGFCDRNATPTAAIPARRRNLDMILARLVQSFFLLGIPSSESIQSKEVILMVRHKMVEGKSPELSAEAHR